MFEQSRTDHNVPKAVHLKPVINTIRGRLEHCPLMPALFEDSVKVFFFLSSHCRNPPLHQSGGLRLHSPSPPLPWQRLQPYLGGIIMQMAPLLDRNRL